MNMNYSMLTAFCFVVRALSRALSRFVVGILVKWWWWCWCSDDFGGGIGAVTVVILAVVWWCWW